jgi:hypothetical protein
LLLVFNGLLVLFTGLLYWATAGLFKETAGLRSAADQQSRDMQKSIIAAQDSAKAAMLAVHSDRAWMVFSTLNISIFENGRIDGKEVNRGISCSAVWINSGRSPAINSQVFAQKKIVQINEKSPQYLK